MIISRTPFRISFVGGGSDLRSFYRHRPGKVLSAAIDKYIYVVVKRQLGIVEHKYRVNWSRVEFRDSIDEIEHPIVRESLRLLDIDFPLEITTFADIPASTGLGSSSAFTVGLLHALYALRGQMVSKYHLASTAAKIEIDILNRVMGKQDHFASSYGSINTFSFFSDESVHVQPVYYKQKILQQLEDNLLLVYTGLKRDASKILSSQDSITIQKLNEISSMTELVDPLSETFTGKRDLDEFGSMLHANWTLKRSLTSDISSTEIDHIYNKALQHGAIGGKLLGAGGGGFILFYTQSQHLSQLRDALLPFVSIPVKFDSGGTRITYYDQSPHL